VIIAFKILDLSEKKPKITIRICSDIFGDMIAADPTDQKIYLQWMLNVLTDLIKNGNYNYAKNFATEDLGRANEYLTLFDANKRKKKFVEFCGKTHGLKHIDKPSDINQFKDLSQLFDAVDPFIERTASDLEQTFDRFVKMGDGEIPFRDRKWLVFIPRTRDAACAVNTLGVSWCTADRNNSNYFEQYTWSNSHHRLPNGKKSTIYIVINTDVFTGESKECYQLHFESGQLHDRSNSRVDFYDKVIKTSRGIDEYFKEELMSNANLHKKGEQSNNKYINYLLDFGHTDCLFDVRANNALVIEEMKRKVLRLPDMSRFTKLESLTILKTGLVEINESIGYLTNLEILSVPHNSLTALPKEIGKLRNLTYLNLVENPIVSLPEELGQLDPSKGGNLTMVSLRKTDISKDILEKFKRLLPNVSILS
jgi:hypothetical protein